jgi:osmotically inducible lipoprotein OsmB
MDRGIGVVHRAGQRIGRPGGNSGREPSFRIREPGLEEENMASRFIALALATGLLAACGTSTTDRALSGGAIGAGAGALGGAVLGGSPVTGALLGGAAGAAAGGLTDSSDVDLGKPVWRR